MTIPGVISNQVPVEPWKGGGSKWKSTFKKMYQCRNNIVKMRS